MGYVTTRSHPQLRGRGPINDGLGDLGLQIGPKLRLGGSVGKVLGNVQKTVEKAAVDTGHTVGKVASNKYVIGAEAGVLAATGAGVPFAATLLASQKAAANLIKPGGNLKSAATGAYQGAITGVAAGLAPSILRGGVNVLKSGGSLLESGVKKLVGGVETGAKDIVSSIFPSSPNAKPSDAGSGSTPRTGRQITNGDATQAGQGMGGRRRAGTTSTTGETPEQTIARLLAGAQQQTPTPYSSTGYQIPGGDLATYSAPTQAGLFSSPTVPIAIAGAALLFVVTRPSRSRGRR